jgi:hypothetical protein
LTKAVVSKSALVTERSALGLSNMVHPVSHAAQKQSARRLAMYNKSSVEAKIFNTGKNLAEAAKPTITAR